MLCSWESPFADCVSGAPGDYLSRAILACTGAPTTDTAFIGSHLLPMKYDRPKGEHADDAVRNRHQAGWRVAVDAPPTATRSSVMASEQPCEHLTVYLNTGACLVTFRGCRLRPRAPVAGCRGWDRPQLARSGGLWSSVRAREWGRLQVIGLSKASMQRSLLRGQSPDYVAAIWPILASWLDGQVSANAVSAAVLGLPAAKGSRQSRAGPERASGGFGAGPRRVVLCAGRFAMVKARS